MHTGGGDSLCNRPFSHISDLRDLDLDLGSGHTAHRRVYKINLQVGKSIKHHDSVTNSRLFAMLQAEARCKHTTAQALMDIVIGTSRIHLIFRPAQDAAPPTPPLSVILPYNLATLSDVRKENTDRWVHGATQKTQKV